MFTKVKAKLEENGFAVSVFETGREAAEYLDKCIDGATVGMGGSVTLQNIGIYEKLTAHNTVFWHWHGGNKAEIIKNAQTADVYISSVNGLAESGEIINIDGNCNRVSAIQYGHKKVYLVIGPNKLAPDYESALFRARNIASPLNAKRLARKTPCAIKGDKCYNCNSPERICRGLSVMWKAPGVGEYEVILIKEALGY